MNTPSYGRSRDLAGSIAFGVLIVGLLSAVVSAAQTLRKGIHVELAPTRHAMALPAADDDDAVVIAVTHDGSVYLGIDRITPAALAEKRDLAGPQRGKLFLKADARAPYASVVKVLKALREAGVKALDLLTDQPQTPRPAARVFPQALGVQLGAPTGTETAVVQMLASGQSSPVLKLNGQSIPGERLQSRLTELLVNQPEKAVVIKADAPVPYNEVVHVIDECQAAGAQVTLAVTAG